MFFRRQTARMQFGLTLIGVVAAVLLLGACTTAPVANVAPAATEPPAATVPPTEVAPTEVPPTEVAPTEVPPTEVPPTEVAPTEVPPTEVPPTEVPPTTEPTTTVAGPAAIPHTLEGREECLTCHAADSTVAPVPADHEGRTNDTCQMCHKPAAAEETSPATTPEGTAAAEGTTAPEGTPQAMTSDVCLGCHGPFDKLESAAPFYTTDADETINPHRYIPHDSDKVPECTNCHKPHPIPLQSVDDVAQANVDYCYNACHHAFNFTPCSECHQDQG